MMRYQRVSPDCVPPLANAKKPNTENGRSITNGFNHTSASFDTAKGFRFRSPSRTHDHHNHNISPSPPHSDAINNQTQRQETSPSPSRALSGDVFVQWGQKKRARVSRSEIRALGDESSSSGQGRQTLNKVPRRMDTNNIIGTAKLSPPATMPPPPPPQPPISANTRGGGLKKESSVVLPHSHRNLEKRSGAGNGSPSRNSGGSSRAVSRSTAAGKRSPPTPENIDRKIPTSSRSSSAATKVEKPNDDMINRHDYASPATQSELVSGLTNTTPSLIAASAAEKNVAEVIEWPRIYIALSRKEKEDDFFAMKGTKLPQRPKKRAKNVDKALQYCFPGMWLSDLTKSRYEVREKKCVKKQKRRGLKGMESMDSDSE